MAELLAFAAVAAAIVALPGPATTLVMSSAMSRDLRAAMLTALGLFTADLIWVSASAAGLTAVLVASQPAFEALRLLGAAYLIYLGITLLLARHAAAEQREEAAADTSYSSAVAFRQGVVCNLSNPKTLLVFTSVIPQFAPGHPTGITLGLYGALFAGIGLGASVLYALIFSRARTVASHPRLRQVLLRASGAALVGFGVRLATEPR